MSLTNAFRVVVVLALFRCWMLSASAQTTDAAHGPLFGADAGFVGRRSVDVAVAMTHGRDDDLGADSGTGVVPLQPQVGGMYEDLDASLALAETSRRFSLSARATGTARRYAGLDQFVGTNNAATADLSVSLGRKTSLRTSLGASHVSTFAFDAFSQRVDAAQAVSPSNAVDSTGLDWTRTTYGGTVALTRTVGRRSTFTVVGGASDSERRTVGQRSDDQSVSALFGRSVGGEGAVRASYTFHQGIQTIGAARGALWSHELQLNAERTWRHSKFRRTAISVSGGPSLFQQRTMRDLTVATDTPTENDLPIEPVTVKTEEVERLSRFVGTAALTHDVSRTWSTQAWYRRGTGVRDAVFFSNTAGLDIRGRFGRRVSVTVSAGYTDGDVGLGSSNRYGTSFGSTRLQAALGRSVALQAQYFSYRYKFGPGAPLPDGLLPQVYRRGLRLGIVVWAPVQRG